MIKCSRCDNEIKNNSEIEEAVLEITHSKHEHLIIPLCGDCFNCWKMSFEKFWGRRITEAS